MSFRILVGDCRDSLKSLADQSVQCCVTSPPYYGLRDYGTASWEGGDAACDHVERVMKPSAKSTLEDHGADGRSPQLDALPGIPFRQRCGKCGAQRIDLQLGLEKTPAEYVEKMVAVFREVRRVLRNDGTLWLNIGDSYNAGRDGGHAGGMKQAGLARHNGISRSGANVPGCKPKDLIGIPWALAKALRDPYYTGSIKDERDRIWLAAMLDAEGCLFIHKRKEGQHNGQGYHRKNANYGPGVEISNTSLALVERIASIVGKGSICSQGPNENHRRKQTIYRWNLRTTESRDFVRELYPYLVAKKQQARILYGCPSSGERAEAAHAALISLHRTGESTVDFPAPPPMFEPGFYLRSDIIWNKSNPMPESVTDRPTKSHEYLFLLSKSERYFFDADAVREAHKPESENRYRYSLNSAHSGFAKDARTGSSFDKMRDGAAMGDFMNIAGRNIRSVWTISTMPYSGAHFATFPPKLIEPCILAGSARQACEHCGKAWERQVEGGKYEPPVVEAGERFVDESRGDKTRKLSGADWHKAQADKRTIGFAPSCDCGSTNPVPSTVLDPFGGAGTTGLVADRLGRDSILCELNEQYAEMARKRITDDSPLFAERLGA